jgi:hypothetical protein
MKNPLSPKYLASILLSCLTLASQAQEADSRWRLRVMDLQNQPRVDATIRFTEDAARSCMGGTWKRIVVETRTAQAEQFFPLAEPLAYKVEDGKLTLGCTEVCDGYLFLSEKPNGAKGPLIQGSYDAVGWGIRNLGSFSLQKIP